MDRIHVSSSISPADGRWDKNLFPNHVDFLKQLHDRDLKVSLNIHPADGVRSFEEPYVKMCEAVGRKADGMVCFT